MDCREAFENWVKDHNDAPIKWIGHSYANAYMAAQWEGFKAAYNSRADQTAPETVESAKAEQRRYFNAFDPDFAPMLHRHGDALIDHLTANGFKIVKVGE